MALQENKSWGERINHLWDQLSLEGRFELVLDYAEEFLEMNLISCAELVQAVGMSEAEREYILTRESQRVFGKLDLTKGVVMQKMRHELRDTLRFINS